MISNASVIASTIWAVSGLTQEIMGQPKLDPLSIRMERWYDEQITNSMVDWWIKTIDDMIFKQLTGGQSSGKNAKANTGNMRRGKGNSVSKESSLRGLSSPSYKDTITIEQNRTVKRTYR